MIKIQDVNSEYCINGAEVKDSEELKNEWEDLSTSDREGWYTAQKCHKQADAKCILYNLFDEFEDNGYEEMALHCWCAVTDEQIAELQKTLNDICSSTAFDVYYPDEKIY